MNATIQLLLSISLQAGILAAVVWMLTRMFQRAPAALRHVLWVIVLAKFFIPPFAYLPNEVAFWQDQHNVQPVAVHSVQAEAYNADSGYESPGEASMTTDSISPHTARYSISGIGNIMIMLWLAGVFVMGLILVVRFIRQKRLVVGSLPGDDLLNLLKHCANQMRVRRIPKLILSQTVHVPMVMGVFNPSIILPEKISNLCSRSELTAIVLHELAHIKRRDLISIWLHQTVRVLFFFHPAIWLAGHEIKKEQEIACDELVLLSSAISMKEYASGYVSAIRFSNECEKSPVAAAMAEPFSVEMNRLNLMLRERIPKFSGRWMLMAGIIAALGIITFVGVAGSSDVPSPEFIAAALKAQEDNTGRSLDVTYTYSRSDGSSSTNIRYVKTPAVGFMELTRANGTVEKCRYDKVSREYKHLITNPGGEKLGQIAARIMGPLGNNLPMDPIRFNFTGIPLVECIGNGTVAPAMEDVDGHSCWRINIPSGRDDVQGYSVWLDPEIGFCPRRVEMSYKSRQPWFVNLKDYHNLGNDVWFPMRIEYRFYVNSPAVTGQVGDVQQDMIYAAEHIYIDRPITDEDVAVDFPPGTRVSDDVHGETYVVP